LDLDSERLRRFRRQLAHDEFHAGANVAEANLPIFHGADGLLLSLFVEVVEEIRPLVIQGRGSLSGDAQQRQDYDGQSHDRTSGAIWSAAIFAALVFFLFSGHWKRRKIPKRRKSPNSK